MSDELKGQPFMMVMDRNRVLYAAYITIESDTAEYRKQLAADAEADSFEFESKYADRIAMIKQRLRQRYADRDPDDDFVIAHDLSALRGVTPMILAFEEAKETAKPSLAKAPVAIKVEELMGSVTPHLVRVDQSGELAVLSDIADSRLVRGPARHDLIELSPKIKNSEARNKFVDDHWEAIAFEASRFTVQLDQLFVIFYPYGESDRVKLIEHPRFQNGVPEHTGADHHTYESLYTGRVTGNDHENVRREQQEKFDWEKAVHWQNRINFKAPGLINKLAERPVIIFPHDGKIGYRKLVKVNDGDHVQDLMLKHANSEHKKDPKGFVSHYQACVYRTLWQLKKDYPDLDISTVLVCLEPSMDRSVTVRDSRIFASDGKYSDLFKSPDGSSVATSKAVVESEGLKEKDLVK